MTGRHGFDEVGGWVGSLGLPVAFVLLNGLLLLPGWILRGGPGPPWVAGEALLVVAIFLVLPDRRWSGFLAALVATLALGAGGLLLGDAAARESLSRPMSLYLDWHLLDAVWRLMVGAVGTIPTVLGVLGGLVVSALLVWILFRLLREGRPSGRPSRARVAGGAVLLALATVATVAGRIGVGATGGGEDGGVARTVFARVGSVIDWPGARLVVEQTREARELLAESERFARELRETPTSHADVQGLLDGLGGRTVVLAFVESYGISTLRNPRYSAVLRPRLEELGRRMEAADLSLATGSLIAPTQGGQSWFSHGSLLSGLWLDNQAKYDLLMTTERETLIDDFERAGYETVALMPAITLAWPEGEWFGYDQIYAFQDIDYAGPPLNWVTMPDQFTWSFFENRIRTHDPDRPVFAEMGLISSHAPWTPILPVLADWSSIGDGSVFAPWKDAGERPEELWRDVERVRDHFALSVDYAIHAMTSYAEEYVDDDVLLIVMGDHQPAPLITGDGASRAVPIHVISGDSTLVAPFLEWGFEPGAIPPADDAPPGMDAFREWFVRAFSRPSGAGGEAVPGRDLPGGESDPSGPSDPSRQPRRPSTPPVQAP